ncbi:MAG: hypothetical protein ACLQF1_17030 [Methyloceanibacter sp.]
MSMLHYWTRAWLCRGLLTIAECAFALAGAVAPEEVKRLRRARRVAPSLGEASRRS